MSRFEDAIPTVLQHEGGYCDDANDPGGATNYGISLRYLKQREDRGEPWDADSDGIDAGDIRNLTREQAVEIYRTDWWERNGYEAIENQALATKMLDCAVNLGHERATLIFQRALNTYWTALREDGILGPKTRAAINAAPAGELLAEVREQCAEFYMKLVRRRPKMRKFLTGWLRRAYS